MTNAQLNTLINTIETGGLNTALEVRDVLQGIKNEMFPTIHNMLVTSDGTNINYNLRFTKIGSLVYMNGYVLNDTPNIISSQVLITIDNSLYFAKSNREAIITKGNTLFSISNSSLYLINNLPIGVFIYFNEIYQTND
jgi:hypothetical protein